MPHDSKRDVVYVNPRTSGGHRLSFQSSVLSEITDLGKLLTSKRGWSYDREDLRLLREAKI
jgi:hypothetical protein